jgi:hypothetical protein
MSIAEIEKAIQQLPAEQLARLRAWFAEFDAAQWDRQFEQDVAAGKLDALGDEAISDGASGSAMVHCRQRSNDSRMRTISC